MPSERRCEKCGAVLAAFGTEALCPKCMLHEAVGLGPDSPASPEARTVESIAPAAPLAKRDTILVTPVTEQPGDKIGRYKLLQQIGEGGMGVVYMAEQEEPVRRRVALKVIKLGMDTKSVIARFEAERQALALMDHSNIAKVFDAGATDTGRPYFVMELVRGIRITDYCDQNHLSTQQRLDLFTQICKAIQHAHQKGIIHRDIKPSNILVTLHDGVPVPKIIDFGIAKATSDQRLTDKTLFTAFEQFIGTPAYMSPEQAELSGLDIDTRSDIYSLGVLLYELLTGQTPFEAKELLAAGLDAMRRTIREKEPPKPSTRLSTMGMADTVDVTNRFKMSPTKLAALVRGDLDWIVMKALEKDRTRRYDTANDLVMDIQRHLDNEPVLARSPSTAYRFQKMIRRNKGAAIAVSAVVLALILGLGSATFALIRERTALHSMIEAERRSALERVRFSILSGDDDRTEQALREAAQKGVPTVKLKFLRGQYLVTSGRPQAAVEELNAVRELEPANVAALGLLATANRSLNWEDYERLVPELYQAKPVTPEEHLFLGQALALTEPEAGIPLMEKAVRLEDSPMARTALATARTALARERGDLQSAKAALNDVAAAEAWSRNSMPVLYASSYAHRVAATLHLRAGATNLAQGEIIAADAAGQRLEGFYPNVMALNERVEQLHSCGFSDKTFERVGKWAGETHNPDLQFKYGCLLLRRGESLLAYECLRPAGATNPTTGFVLFLAALDLPEHRSECQEMLRSFSAERRVDSGALYDAVVGHQLLGQPVQAREVAKEFQERARNRLAGLRPNYRRLVRFMAGELGEEPLLEASRDSSSALCESHFFVGLQYFAQGDRTVAKQHFLLAAKTGRDDYWAESISQVILSRLERDSDWPSSIPTQTRKP